MPRCRRLHAPDTLHHLIARFVNKEHRMYADPERREYLRRVVQVTAGTDAVPLAYALMSNHIHWVIWAGGDADSRFIHPLHVGFAGWLNRVHRRSGPVFRARFTSVLCEAERAALLIAYQHNNPVRAGLCSDPADCDWTSHRAFLGLSTAPPWLDVPRALSLCGFDASPAGRSAFHSFVLSRATQPRDRVLSGQDAASTRRAARRHLGAPAEVSDSALAGPALAGRRQILVRPHGVVRPRWPGEAMAVVQQVSRRTGVPVASMQSRSRAHEVLRARRLALWLWARELGRWQSEMNGVLGLSSGTASVVLRRASAAERELASALAKELWGTFCEPGPSQSDGR